MQEFKGGFLKCGIGVGVGDHAIQGLSLGLCQTVGHFQRFCTQTPGRIVDDAAQAQIIRPVVNDAEIGQHIFDFGPVEESGASDNPIWNAVAFQRIFQGVGLGIGTVKNGKVPHSLTTGGGQNLTGNEICLRHFVRCLIHHNGRAVSVGCPQLLSLPAQVVGNHRIGRIQNGLGGAIVLLQANGSAATILLFEAENVFDGGTAEAVNTLVIVSHHADILMATCQCRCKKVLQMVGVLVLVHQDIAEFLLIVSPDILVLQQQLDGDVNDVVKIQGVVFL